MFTSYPVSDGVDLSSTLFYCTMFLKRGAISRYWILRHCPCDCTTGDCTNKRTQPDLLTCFIIQYTKATRLLYLLMIVSVGYYC